MISSDADGVVLGRTGAIRLGVDVIGDPLEHRDPKLDWLTTREKNCLSQLWIFRSKVTHF